MDGQLRESRRIRIRWCVIVVIPVYEHIFSSAHALFEEVRWHERSQLLNKLVQLQPFHSAENCALVKYAYVPRCLILPNLEDNFRPERGPPERDNAEHSEEAYQRAVMANVERKAMCGRCETIC